MTTNGNVRSHLNWLESQKEEMVTLVEQWANINSSSHNFEGLSQMLHALITAFAPLNCHIEQISLPQRTKIDGKGHTSHEEGGIAFRAFKHPNAPITVLLGGHMDTVFAKDSPFQTAKRVNSHLLCGPGVADMKGGLVILLKSLEALEKSPSAGKIGWEVIINPDEELGSPSSEHLWRESAKRHTLGLLFEPSFPDGSIVIERKGSANFTVIAQGKAAHAGRDFHLGRNAISALSSFILDAETLNDIEKGITLNVGYIEGGGPVNIVPDLAMCKLNTRMKTASDLDTLRKELQQIIAKGNQKDGITLTLYEQTARLPKPYDERHQQLFKKVEKAASELNMKLSTTVSGGVCDGNILSQEGLPNIDTMGVVGGNIHTHEEYLLIDSLVERAKLTAYFLMKLSGGIDHG